MSAQGLRVYTPAGGEWQQRTGNIHMVLFSDYRIVKIEPIKFRIGK